MCICTVYMHSCHASFSSITFSQLAQFWDASISDIKDDQICDQHDHVHDILLPFFFRNLGISTRLLKQASLSVDRRKILENYLMQLDGTIDVNHFLYEPQTCIGS